MDRYLGRNISISSNDFFSSIGWPVITVLAIAGLVSLLESGAPYLIGDNRLNDEVA